MKRFASHYTLTGTGAFLRKAIITTGDDGTILDVEDTGGDLKEEHSVEFHSGIIVPGFVNCHCHLELSHLKDRITRVTGLHSFISQIRQIRDSSHEKIEQYAYSAGSLMFRNGIVLCADICNTADTFSLKTESAIKYISLIEVFGIDGGKASKRIREAESLAAIASEMNLPHYIVPHSAYSVSLTLFRLLREITSGNEVTSMHFMESPSERAFLQTRTGEMMEAYRMSGLLKGDPEPPEDHAAAVLNEVTPSGNLILVHNTFADKETIRKVNTRKDVYWCLCPNSNLYIEGTLPPVKQLLEENCRIVLGTDSLASNNSLDLLEEMKTLQSAFPWLSLPEITGWATLNGAKALNEESQYGSIRPGMKPGLLLIENADLPDMKLTPESTVRRLI
jgi:aminodeoxyfutalosine deaminase